MDIKISIKIFAKYHCQLRKCKVPHEEGELCEYCACEGPLWFARSEEISFIFIVVELFIHYLSPYPYICSFYFCESYVGPPFSHIMKSLSNKVLFLISSQKDRGRDTDLFNGISIQVCNPYCGTCW